MMAATVESHHLDETSLHKDHFREPSTPTTPRQQLPATIHDGSVASERNLVVEPSSGSAVADGHSPQSAPDLHPHEISQTGTPLAQDSRPPLQPSAQVDGWISMDVDDPDDDQDGSDNDTENGEAGTSAKKKKGQRFFCTGYPPCNLSFTRSEHLARHIRKHTGERPFQCHCSRRFSRLDNLRQHAQTVHVNEEIPTDSLAATGTRFQRQIRTDRVRPAGRPRTNTMSSTSSHGRAHTRNLSASSIGSTSSNFSVSTEARRRPPPLLMPNDSGNRPKVGLEPPSTPPTQYRGFTSNSPGDMGTPTSSTYSVTPGSPGYGSSMGSPISSSARVGGFFGNRTPGRRLSVPSGASPFPQSFVSPHPGQYMTTMAPPSTTNSNSSSVYPSPVSSTFAYSPAYQVSPGEDWRRRTWHPSTYSAAAFNYSRPATSGLSYSQTPDAPQPAFAQNATAAAGQAPRLPGIESFDQVQHRPSTPPRRGPSPMQVDVIPYPGDRVTGAGSSQADAHYSGQRQGHVSWERVQKPIIYQSSRDQVPMPRDTTSWSQQTMKEIQHVVSSQESGVALATRSPAPTSGTAQQQQIARDALQMQNIQPRTKRNGWYNGPIPLTRTSPEGSSSSEGVTTPGTSSAEVNPVIVHSNGYIEPHHAVLAADVQANPCMPPPGQVPPYATRQDETTRRAYYPDDGRDGRDMGRLEALVAVATSEDKAATSIR